MATVYEMLDTNVGGTRGQDGIHGFVRRFHVTTDSVDDDPSHVLQNEFAGDGTGGITLFSSHPWTRGIVVTNFREVERVTQTQWVVEAIYGRPLDIDPTRPWDIAIDTSLETYTAYTDRDNQPIGPGVYHPVPTPEEFPGDTLELEKKRLRHLGWDTEVIFRAPTPDGFKELYSMTGKRRAVGIQCTRPVSQFSLSRVLPNLSAGQIGAAINLTNTVNSQTFFGARPGCAKFVGMRSRSRSGELIGQIAPGVTFEVELIFVHDKDGHDPSSEYDLFEGKDGLQGIVEDSEGFPVKRGYRLYKTCEYNSLITSLGSGGMPSGGGDGKVKLTRPNSGPTGRLSGGGGG